ncbi:phage tail length tape measure family protein [Delftia sp. PS-11]|uniref:phage tail length tape measure family protein n=1 Tax=Delftia sp. PS-11 TaxID=2767222 RepID=UPI002453ACD3|nr:phage tail length tape measure family protein [Delftia sp. PS-11]KAJ8743692.1 phage tail length tape measure family protein [Delftia sp. PS-11]
MEEKNRKIGFVVSAEDDTKNTFQNIKAGAADMASSVAKSGEQAAKGVKGIGDGADEAAQKMARAESAMAQALQRATEKAKIAAQAGDSLSRAFEQKIEMRGLDASKLNPLVAKLREAEDALASFKAQQARDAGQSSFLESLRAQTDALGKTKSELLALQAAQLGVTNQAAPYIAKLRETEAGMGKVGVSAAQTAAAMRMVPAQFTDIVVSLQSGQEPLTVLLQQGGQLKDMFGTAGAAARGLASYVAGLVNPFTVAAAAVATLGVAYYQGSKETDAFRTALVLSGNQAGTTVDELNAMARAIASVSGTQGAAAAGLAEMARHSKVGADQLKDFTAVALVWEKTTGQAVGETAKQFAELAKDPLQASLALNEQMNHLTASVYDQIKALEKQGKTSEAAAVAQKAYADAMKTGADELTQNLGYIERAVQFVTGSAKKMWDAILGVGRQTSPTDQAAKHLETLQQKLNNKLVQGPLNGQTTESYNKGLEIIKKEIQQATDFLAFAGAAGKSIAEMQTVSKDYIDATEEFDKIAGQFASKEVKRKRELTVAENLYNNAVEKTKKAFADTPELSGKLSKLKADYENTIAGIEKRFAEKGKTSGGISISDNQLANLEGQLVAAKQYREQLLMLGAAASDLNAGERESLKLAAQIERATDAKTKAKLAEAKAMADAWGAQVRSNDELEKSQKAHAAIIADNYKSADAIAERAREQDAANSVYGKGRTEIERMTLAMLENQMAEAQGSDRFDPKYIASLEAKIAAQKRWVAALGDADYKQFDDRLTKSLEASKEALAIQHDGLSLLGLDELQRKKLVAQRRIELDLAKELVLIEKAKFSDDPIENLIAQQALKGKAREKAEIDTQTALLRIQEEYVNKQVDQYDEVFRKGFADMLNNGKDGWDSFTKSLTTTFKTTVADQIYKMFLRPFVVQVVASLVGVEAKSGVSSVLNSAGASGSGVGSALSSLSGISKLSSLFGGGTTAGASITSLGYANAVGLAGGDAIGALAAANAQWAGVATGAQAAAQAAVAANAAMEAGTAVALEAGTLATASSAAGAGGLSAALGAIPGWGWALAGGALLLGSMDFGSRGANHTGGAYSTSTGDRNVAASQALGSDAWGNALGDITSRANADLDAQLGKTVDALSGVYTSLAKYAGSSAKQIDIAAAFAVNPSHSDEDNYGYFRLIDKITGEALSTYKARDGVLGTDPKVAYEKFVGEMGGALIAQLKAADIPGWMRSIFNDVGEVVTVDGLNKALTAIAAVDSAFKGWADTLKGFASLSAEAQTSLIKTSGGIDALAGNVNAFYSGFYTEQERMATLQRQVLQQLAGLGVTVDTSTAEAAKESFRRTVEGALDAGNAELAAKLLAMSGSFATAADYAANAAEEAAKVAEDAASKTAAAAEEAARALAELRKQAAGIVQSQQQSLDSLIAGLQRKAEQANGGYVGSLWLSGAEFTQFSGFADQLDGATAALAQLQALGLGDELAGYTDQIGAIVQQTKEALSGALSSQRLMAGDAAGALAAAVSAGMPQYADFTQGGQFNAGGFNAAVSVQRAQAASGLISDASANALSIPGIAGVLGGLVGEIATYSRDVVLRDLRVQGAESLGSAVSGMLTGVYERLADAAQAQMISGPGLAGVMSARMQYGGAAADVQAFGQAVEAVRGALDEGRISAVEADKALAYLNGAFGDLAPLLSDVAGQTARAAAAAVDLRNAGVASVEYYFGSLAGVVSKMDAAAAAANSPLAQTADVIGLLDSTATAFGQSASAALEGAQAAITGYLDAAAMAREQGAWADSWAYSSRAADAQLALGGLTAADSRVSRAQLIADAAATASGIMTTASAAKAAQELAGKLVLGEGQSMRDLSLLVSGVGQYDNAGFYDAFARISDALGSGSISNEQYKTLFDYATGVYQGVSEEAKATASAFERLRDSMKSFADQLLIGDKTTLSPEATLAEMQRQYAEAFSAAAGGDTEAISKYQSLANGLLDKSLYSTRAEYNVAFGRAYGDARALESQGVNVLAQQQNGVVTELKALNASLTRRVGDLERILAQIAKNTAETSRGVEGIALGT